jgi:tRNA-2-methylthio-N6-dimethylallyladenosine synthase
LPDRVPEIVKRERLGRVIALQKQHTVVWLRSRRGQGATVLIGGVSRQNADEFIGRTEHDEMVVVPAALGAPASFVKVTLASLRGNTFRTKEFFV